jgi:hypothetical protein
MGSTWRRILTMVTTDIPDNVKILSAATVWITGRAKMFS